MQPEMIGGRYRVEAAIGQGGMGTVWLGHDEKLAREVAIKQVGLLPGESVTDSARALREARSTAALSHRNVVTVFDVVDEDGAIWLVMEHVPSRSLSQMIREDGALPPATVADIGAQVADGLAAAHAAGITHRDVKPGNVLVREDGLAKISDFGIARTAGDPSLTQTGLFIGTPAYFAPEIARGDDPGPAADVWALGATLYAAVEGRPPYELSPNHLAVLNKISDGNPPPPKLADFLEPTIARMLDRDPASRWSMADAAHALHQLSDRHGERTRATTTSAFPGARVDQATTRPSDGRRTAAAAGAGVAGAGAAGAATAPRGGVATDTTDDATTGPRRQSPAPASPPARPDGPDRGRRRGPLWAVAAVVALLLLGGLAFLTLDRDDGTETPTAGDTPSSTGEPDSSPREGPEQAEQSEQPESGTAGQVAFIEDYFSTVPEDTTTGWSMLGPGGRAVGRESYEGWWSSVSDVQVSNIEPAPSGDSVDVTLRYTMNDGRVETERQRLALIRSEDGGWLINGDEQI